MGHEKLPSWKNGARLRIPFYSAPSVNTRPTAMISRAVLQSGTIARTNPVTHRTLSHSARLHWSPTPIALAMGKVLFDQTKESNDPNKEKRKEHADNTASQPNSGAHPAKEAEAAQNPTRSTGFKTEGKETQTERAVDNDVHVEQRKKPGPNQTWGGT